MVTRRDRSRALIPIEQPRTLSPDQLTRIAKLLPRQLDEDQIRQLKILLERAYNRSRVKPRVSYSTAMERLKPARTHLEGLIALLSESAADLKFFEPQLGFLDSLAQALVPIAAQDFNEPPFA